MRLLRAQTGASNEPTRNRCCSPLGRVSRKSGEVEKLTELLLVWWLRPELGGKARHPLGCGDTHEETLPRGAQYRTHAGWRRAFVQKHRIDTPEDLLVLGLGLVNRSHP